MTDVTPPTDTAAGSVPAGTAGSAPAGTVSTAPAGTAAGAAPASASTPAAETGKRPNHRRIREGKVISAAMDKTAVVEITDRVRHPRYFKIVTRRGRLYVHDPLNDLGVGDTVRIQETRPISKTKRWRVLEIVERAR